MQELRLVAVSEDGTYLVLATAGRGTRLVLPIDERLRAAVRGNVSRLGQLQIEVESPLRPKEIQARIRAGETAEEIAETAGIPVERVRWFEGPVLQEREYVAQQAQRIPLRRAGDTTPGPSFGEVVEERLAARGVDIEDVEWDAWKREDGTWKVRLHFQAATRSYTAEWIFEPTRRHISPVDEDAAQLSSLDEVPPETVTPFVPRLAPAPEPEKEPEEGPPTEHVVPAAEPEVPAAPAAAQEQPARRGGRRSAAGGRGRRASVPSWDEIMFGTSRRRD